MVSDSHDGPDEFRLCIPLYQPRSPGRCHTALGEHELAAACLDASRATAKTGELVLSEALAVRERALAGKAAGAGATTDKVGGVHWAGEVGRQRVLEVVGRMTGGDKRLAEELLLRGL